MPPEGPSYSLSQMVRKAVSRRFFLGSLFSATVAQGLPQVPQAHGKGRDEAGSGNDPQHPDPRLDDLLVLADPNIGGIGHVLTSLDPEVQLPHGRCLIAPVVAAGVTDAYLATRVYGFSLGASILMASNAAVDTERIPSSEWDHDMDSVRPSHASYLLEDSGILVEYTVSAHCAHFRFTALRGKPIFLSLRPGETATYRIIDSLTIEAIEQKQSVQSYVRLELSHPSQSQSSFQLAIPQSAPEPENGFAARVTPVSQGCGVQLSMHPTIATVEVRIGLSYIDLAQAKRNLEAEIPVWGFDGTRSLARSRWNASLGKIRVRGGSAEQRAIFYTALYRSLQFMKDVTEQGRYYGPFDHTVHDAQGRRFYIEDNLWDTYRCRHPLQTILEPEVNQDQINSFVRLYEQSGWMPQFPFMSGDLPFMSGNHAAPMILDSYQKGQRNFNVEKAYAGAKKAALEATMLPYRRGALTELDHFHATHGYFPALRKGEKETVPEVDADMRRQAVAVTLDAAYDDWCLAELARLLGKQSDAAFFAKRALNYRNVFNPETGWMTPRSADGKFIEGFNPKWSGGQAGRDYFTECNGWVYQFDVQHDIAGLIGLMSGSEKFVQRLDELFGEGYDGNLKFVFLSQFPDSTGLIGQFPQGNEPSFHIPYLYNYAGAPWKTQRRVRQIMQTWYAARPLGLPGDDDNGSMTSWYVFSAMGFYPVCPGRPIYALGSPIFDEATIDVGDGRTFRVIAGNNSAANKYIQSAELNGEPLERTWFDHATLMAGGTLQLQMGPRPNVHWGIGQKAAPPSLSDPE